jgi:hypothetical protein
MGLKRIVKAEVAHRQERAAEPWVWWHQGLLVHQGNTLMAMAASEQRASQLVDLLNLGRTDAQELVRFRREEALSTPDVPGFPTRAESFARIEARNRQADPPVDAVVVIRP